MHNNTFLNTDYIGRSHSERAYNPDFSVIFTNVDTAEKVQIVDRNGNICNFPGITLCDALCSEMNVDKIRPVVAYSATFEKQPNGQYLMVWTVRPDGRYWMDSWGFGAEDYEWVKLYSFIDHKGQFTAPFQLHSIGYQTFFPVGEEVVP